MFLHSPLRDCLIFVLVVEELTTHIIRERGYFGEMLERCRDELAAEAEALRQELAETRRTLLRSRAITDAMSEQREPEAWLH